MQNKAKTAKESLIIMTEIVLPNDTNVFGNLMGGRLMYWMDIAAALSAGKHCNAPVVTASVDNISFENPIKLGNVVHIEAKVTRAFNTSMMSSLLTSSIGFARKVGGISREGRH